ncbi:unnamed protein product [Porites evermanni]|uniref:Uncharacterized protein n=1 Tax=Porites evermanni TaxID=104178 RepID=A0ABN8RNF3_9CNID|nr:unnamed protein product [Porites evermanni]
MHNFHKCRSTGCTSISKEELDQLKMTKRKIVDEKESTKVLVVQEAFHAMYWLAKESIANRKLKSLLKLMEHLGL